MSVLEQILTFPVLVDEPQEVFEHPARQARIRQVALIVCVHEWRRTEDPADKEAVCIKCGSRPALYQRWAEHKAAGGATKMSRDSRRA